MFRKMVLILIAFIFLSIGLIGIFLPIVPGFIFLFSGIIILSWEISAIKRLRNKALTRFPKLEKHVLKAEKILEKWFRK